MTITPLDQFTPDPHNANDGTERGAGMLERSLEKHGAGRSILVDKNGVVIAGNKTQQAALDLGITDAVVVETDGSRVVVVKRTDLDLLTDARARELAYSDNRVGQVSLNFNPEQILIDMDNGIDLSALWTDGELEALLAGLRTEETAADPGAQVDRAGELREKWQTERGQVWQVGRHRVMCGDSTSAEDVARLMGGTKAALLASDPPYNVGIEYRESVDDEKNDQAYEVFTRAWFNAWQDVSQRQIVTPGCNNLTRWCRYFDPYHVAPWTKLAAMTNGKVSRFWTWEPLLFFGTGWKRMRSNDVFHFEAIPQTANGIGTLTGIHPCPKPLTMWVDILENYSEMNELIIDAFLGTGTTLAACEQTGRTGYGMEIDPGYVGVILERLAGMGLEPRKIEDPMKAHDSV